ncbi:MAG: hypothetical protein LRS49_06595 [Desulfurococcales archaeon]|nr:hypothetical protein [Desulfurococcales archaeon]
MPLTTFEEEIYLRALTGRLVGKAIADLGINKLAVVAPKNIICSSIATATEAAFIDHTGGVTYHFMVELGKNEAEIAKRLKEFGAQVVLLQFGGESPIEEVKKSFVELLKAMAEEQVPGAIVFHVRIFAAGGVKEALKDEKVKEYLKGKDLYVYTVGFDEGKVYVNKVTIEGDDLKLQKLVEYHVTLEHADLLNRSLKDRKVTFQ